MKVRLRYVALWVIPQNAFLLAALAVMLGMPIELWFFSGAALGVATAATLFLLWRKGLPGYEW
jgi:hypothetical protein